MRLYKIIGIICICFSAVAYGTPIPDSRLIGMWEGGGRVYEAMWGRIKLTNSHLYFIGGPKNNKVMCQTPYSVVEQGEGYTYPDEEAYHQHIVKSRYYHHIKIKLEKNKCARGRSLLLAFPSDIPEYADAVDYEENGKVGGWGHFHKLNVDIK